MHAKTYVVALASLTLLVLVANNVAYATTGHSIVAGIGNSSSKTTGLTMTTSGAALKLTTKKGSPPLTVSSSAKVARLNADTLDGLDSTRLLNDTYRFSYEGANPGPQEAISFVIPKLPKGSYLVNYAVTPYALGASTPTPADPMQVACWVDTPTQNYAIASLLQINTTYSGITGSDLMTLGADVATHLDCQRTTSDYTFGVVAITIEFTQTHVVQSSTLSVLPHD